MISFFKYFVLLAILITGYVTLYAKLQNIEDKISKIPINYIPKNIPKEPPKKTYKIIPVYYVPNNEYMFYDDFIDIFNYAKDFWDICGVKFELVENRKDALVIVFWANLSNGENEILADAQYLLNGQKSNLRLDMTNFTDDDNQATVIIHELGHIIHLDHSNKRGNIMYPNNTGHTGLAGSQIKECRETVAKLK